MRAGLGTILQTLTSEAASILNHSIAEAGRRNHGQTTPVHVAATLLGSPTGFLRQACIKSHPNSSHPLQCRALELCFSVALERLPTSQNVSAGSDSEPPISNALMAALKRAQAHQRRGCSELQQQPMLAVKVEFEQLVISILDDPSVSRIMREASFSSPAVKATIERSLNSSASVVNSSSPIGLGCHSSPTMHNRNLYSNPRLHQGSVPQLGQLRGEEIKRIVDVLLRTTKRNPIVVGDSETDAILEEFFRRINKKELTEGPLENAEIIHLEKEIASDGAQIPTKLEDLEDSLATRIANSNCGSVILDLGNLKWLIEQPASSGVVLQPVVSEAARAAVQKIGKLLMKFREGTSGRLWLIGTATCETFLRCQIYHPSIETDWDLHVVSVVAKAPRSGLYPRLGTNEILGSSIESLSPMKFFSTPPITQLRHESEALNYGQKTTCCPQCMQKYEQELQKLTNEEFEKCSPGVKTDSNHPSLPHWLQKAKAHAPNAESVDSKQSKDQELMVKQRTQELQKKWTNTCLRLHPNFHQQNIFSSTGNMPTGTISTTGLYNQNLLKCQPRVELNKSLGRTLQLNMNPQPNQPSDNSSLRTELILGQGKFGGNNPEQTHKDSTKEFLGQNQNSSGPEMKSVYLQSAKLLGITDVDSYKKILKVFMEKVWWQRDAASAVANTITQRKLGNRKRQGAGSKGDIWLLFAGPDKVGKKKMASALSELVSGSILVTICLGTQRNDRGLDNNFRGRTPLDQISEAVRKNPFSVIVLEDIDEADVLFRGSLKRAIESGRLTDSYGREISLGNVIFILTTVWLPDDQKYLSDHNTLGEKELANLASESWQLRLSLSEKLLKRRANWLCNEERSTKTRKDTNPGLFFDLNEAANAEDDTADGSHNSSDLTNDHEDEYGLSKMESTTTSPALGELRDIVDDAIIFKPVNFNHITRDIKTSINEKFSTIIGEGVSIELQDQAVQKILAGVWFGETGLEEWEAKALVPSFNHLKAYFPKTTGGMPDKSIVVTLELDRESCSRSRGDWLPNNIKVVTAVDGL